MTTGQVRGIVVNGRRFYGHLPDADHKRPRRDVREALGAAKATTIPQTFSLRGSAAPTYDQGRSAGCTGHAGAQGTATALAAAGTPLLWAPSPKRLYAPIRAIERVQAADGSLPPLTDSGGMIADIATVASQMGVCPMSPTLSPDGRVSDVWTADDTGDPANTNVNEEPEVVDLAAGSGSLLVGEYALDASSSTLADTIKQTLYVLKAPLVIGVVVGTAVQGFTPRAAPVGPTPASDPERGGHALVVDGYRLMPDGSTAFDEHNSWGAAYGLAGGFLAQLAFLQSCSDIYAWTVRKAA